MLVLQQMGIFFAFLLIGVILRRRDLLSEQSCRQLTWMVVNVITPAMLLSPDLSGYYGRPLSELLWVSGVLLLVQLALTVSAYLMTAALLPPQAQRPIYVLMYIYTNIALIGVPVVTVTFGPLAVFYMSLFIIVNNVAFFSHGALVLSHAGRGRIKMGKALMNPCLLAALLLLLIFLMKLTLPPVLSSFLSRLGAAAPPLAMMLIGASLAKIPLTAMLKDTRLIIFTFTKMLVVPVLVLLLFKLFVSERELLGTCMVIFATPTGVMVGMLVTLLRPEHLPLATEGISLTSAVAVITLPLVSLLTGIS